MKSSFPASETAVTEDPSLPASSSSSEPAAADGPDRRLLLFTKPAVPGRVKTRLIGELVPAQTAELHRAFLLDVAEQLRGGDFRLELAWALVEGESLPSWPELAGLAGRRQEGGDLGDRLYRALSTAAADGSSVGAIGSDHPELGAAEVEAAFLALDRGADVVLGPSSDGGYYLIALASGAVERRLFEGIPWSTESVASATLDRCRELSLDVHLLPEAHDVDLPSDLDALCVRLSAASSVEGVDSVPPDRCRRTRALLRAWGRLPEAGEAVAGEGGTE